MQYDCIFGIYPTTPQIYKTQCILSVMISRGCPKCISHVASCTALLPSVSSYPANRSADLWFVVGHFPRSLSSALLLHFPIPLEMYCGFSSSSFRTVFLGMKYFFCVDRSLYNSVLVLKVTCLWGFRYLGGVWFMKNHIQKRSNELFLFMSLKMISR